ncbi:MAG: hypothetical protein SFW67_17945 [Myxococcaceae bacterium]|nr:hypothetical protein [Myxococcaceae bacterium]
MPTTMEPPPAPRPGWYDVPSDPAVRLGLYQPQSFDGRLLAGTFSFEPAAPPGGYTVTVIWKNHTVEQVVGTVTRDSPSMRGLLSPPDSALVASTCPRGRKSTGTLFVKHGDTGEVVGTSATEAVLTGGYSWEVTYDECASGSRFLPPIVLQREPRLELAHCLTLSRRCADTDPVRVVSSDLEVRDDGVSLTTTFVFSDARETPSLEVNGVALRLEPRTIVYPRSAFRPGRNQVRWRMGSREPWEAVVVLPEASFEPKFPRALRLGAPFTLPFREATWATDYGLYLTPGDAHWTRAVYPSFRGIAAPLEGRFDGFPDGRGGIVTGTWASARFTAVRKDGRCSLSQTEVLTVPIER